VAEAAARTGDGAGDDDKGDGTAARPGGPGRQRSGGLLAVLRETLIVVVLSLAIATIVRVFLLQAFVIPSSSMEDTLLVDDRVVVGKIGSTYHRGDVVVFADPGGWLPPQVPGVGPRARLRDALEFVGVLPDSGEGHLIKRVVGVGGDRVTCCDDDGMLSVNGVAVDEWRVLKPGTERASAEDFDVTVPEGELWVMGDNRDNSADSRVHGTVPVDDVTGRALAVVWPIAHWSGLGGTEIYAAVDR
jgi:signal peptidase I